MYKIMNIQELNNDVIKKIFDFVYPQSEHCILKYNILQMNEYNKLKSLSQTLYKITKKNCCINFMYKPLKNNLPNLYECNKHYDHKKNNIYIINVLNKFKNRHFSKKSIDEIQLHNTEECNFCLPYIKEYANVAYVSDQSNVIYLMNEYDRYSTMF